MPSIFDVIAAKRDGKKLSADEIRFFLNGYLSEEIKDYQMSALLMAVFLNGLDAEELGVWTETMLRSGIVLDFGDIDGIKADKHSTGGVGDKISIPLAPLLASLGLKIPMISGRGLGHTGGTLDKLESIPGFSVNLGPEGFRKQMSELGWGMIGQSPEIVPLDKKLYALRDVTATVASVPLIASSIMSKKLAEGIDGLLLDVKVGNGAFMKTIDQARELGSTMKAIGEQLGKKVAVLYTDMSEPLGYAVGNALEIIESLQVLEGEDIPQVTELTLHMAAVLLKLFGRAASVDDGIKMAKENLINKKALKSFEEMVRAQGGDPEFVTDPSRFPETRYRKEVTADANGYISAIDALSFGKGLVQLGGGRARKEDDVDHAVGFVFERKVGDAVQSDDIVYTIHYNDESRLSSALEYLKVAVRVGSQPVEKRPLIIDSM